MSLLLNKLWPCDVLTGIQILDKLFVIGLRGKTPELAKQTLQNTIELDPDYAQFTLVCPYPGTRLAK